MWLWSEPASSVASSLNSSVRWLAPRRVPKAGSINKRICLWRLGLKSGNFLGHNIRCDDSGGDVSPARRPRFRQLPAPREARDGRYGRDLFGAADVIAVRQQGHDGPQADP